MKITLGEWKTDGGEKAIVAAYNQEAPRHAAYIGWIDGEIRSWSENGAIGDGFEHDKIIAPWSEPVPWDWSTTPPWINWIALSSNGFWWMYSEEPIQDANGWIGYGECAALIPQSYHPKWSGDWKLSKTMRSKEVAK